MPSTSPDSSMRASTMGLFASGDDSIQPVAPMLANGQARKVSNEEKIRREKEKTAKTVSYVISWVPSFVLRTELS